MKNIFVISGPSGAGQDSVISGLGEKLPVEIVITSTTRPKRAGESEGDPYSFIDTKSFEENIKAGKFLEYAKTYNDRYYGVTHEEIQRVAHSGKIGIWKMDWRGAEVAKRIFPTIIAILITAPLTILEARIRRRDNPSEEFIRERMEYTREFLRHTDIYDYRIENEENKLDEAVAKVKAIIESHLEK